MKKLIICEKPSLAKNVIDAISKRESFKRKDGYAESKSYIVSWCFGHLLELKDINDYEGKKLKWSEIKLPYLPKTFQYKLKDDPGVKKQFEILNKLINDKNISEIYNCGDSDREGENIIRNLLQACKNNKVVYRLWLPDQTEKTVLDSLDKKEMDNSTKYNNLAAEGSARTYMDWLLGVNETILLTNKSGVILNAGRVLVPIVKKIYDVDMSISNFTPTIYFQCESEEDGIKLTVPDKYESNESVIELAKKLNKLDAFVEEIKSKEIKKQPSKLFSLTSLQKYMSENFKFSADKTLSICQKLYEKKYLTYPRTDSQYMTIEEKEKVKKIIQALNDPKIEFKDKKTIFDNSKVESHSAITPTILVPEDLENEELMLYKVVCNRFKSIFCKEECICTLSEMKIKCGEYEFNFKGEIIKSKGFTEYEPLSNLRTLPNLKKGDLIKHKFKSVKKQTQPPKKMTEATLLSYLEHPFREKDNEKQVREIGIGTPATRAPIIEKAKKKYIEEKNGNISITTLGIKLIETIEKLGIDLYAEKTIEFSRALKDVNNGSISISMCINNVKSELESICSKANNIKIDCFNNKVGREVIGKCPRCNRNIYESSRSFYCDGFNKEPKCSFSIFKDNKFFKDKGKKVTKKMVKDFIKKGETKVKGLKTKDGKKIYDAKVDMIDNGKYVNFRLKFD